MPTISEQVLARRGVGGYRQYRIPALAVTTRGTVLAAYDGRPNLDDLPSPIDLLLRRSTDHGRTWEPQQVLRTGTGLNGYGDPSLVVDAQTGRVFLFHAAGTRAGFFEAVEGLQPDDDVQHVDLSYSDDDGATWSHRRITGMLKRPGITGLFAAAGAGTQLHTGPYAGRLVQQFVLLLDGEITAASCHSDDHGETWHLGDPVGPGTNENKSVGLADGRVLLHSRAPGRRLAATSTDGGQSYDVPHAQPDLPDPGDNGSLTRYDGRPSLSHLARPATDQWLLATHNHDTELRRNTVLKLSRDDGATWPHALVLCAGSSAYSTATRLADGHIGVLYEREGYQEIVFASVDTDALVDAPALPAPEQLTRPPLEVVLRSVTPARPEVWRSAGPTHTLRPAGAGWDRAVWKEVGQGYTAARPQVLSDRSSQELNYGPVAAGFRAGDVLAFDVRRTDPAGASEVSRTSYRITEEDVAAGRARIIFDGPGSARLGYGVDTMTGDLTPAGAADR